MFYFIMYFFINSFFLPYSRSNRCRRCTVGRATGQSPRINLMDMLTRSFYAHTNVQALDFWVEIHKTSYVVIFFVTLGLKY